MTDTPLETVEETAPDDRLIDALVAFTACIAKALPDICSYGLTIGESYVPFDPDEDEECEQSVVDGMICEQMWVRVENIVPTAINEESFDGQQCDVTLSINLEVGVLRCIEVPAGGEAPTTSQVLAAAIKSMSDMQAIQCAALDCKMDREYPNGETVEVDIWSSIDLGSWVPLGPLGGQYGGVWSMSVEL